MRFFSGGVGCRFCDENTRAAFQLHFYFFIIIFAQNHLGSSQSDSFTLSLQVLKPYFERVSQFQTTFLDQLGHDGDDAFEFAKFFHRVRVFAFLRFDLFEEFALVNRAFGKGKFGGWV